MKLLLLLFFLCSISSVILAKKSPARLFRDYMNIPGGRVLSINFTQKQSNHVQTLAGTLFYENETSYVYEDSYQLIIHTKSNIQTVNKVQKQILYDNNIGGGLQFLDLLSGKDDRFIFHQEKSLGEQICIPFTLEDWDISGNLWTLSSSGEPKRIEIKIAEDYEILTEIEILDLIGTKPSILSEFKGYEIINFRE